MSRASLLRLHEPFASGSTASIHLGWLAPARLVAVKRLHPHVADDELVVARTVEHARLAMRVKHPNVVATLGFVQRKRELLCAMDYVPGASLAEIAADHGAIEPRVACAIVAAALRGLDAAHSTRGVPGWRTLSPSSIVVGEDGRARVIDLDVPLPRAAPLRALVDKLPYAPPERLRGGGAPGDVRRDVYAAAVILWETLTGRPLFHASTVPELVRDVLARDVAPPSRYAPVAPAIDAIVMRGLSPIADERQPTARAMAVELERASRARPEEVAHALAMMDLAGVRRRRARADEVTRIESARMHTECNARTSWP